MPQVTGEPLARGGDDWHAVREGKLRFAGHTGPGMRALVRRMLSPVATDRPSAVDVVTACVRMAAGGRR